MFDREDETFKYELERDLQRMLFGDKDKPGLNQGLRASQSWEMFQRTAGRIEGLEMALTAMDAVMQRMNRDEPTRGRPDRMMN